MSIFDGNMPYTNLHELNNDWIVKTVKEVKDKAETIDDSVAQAKESEENAKISENNAKTSEENAKSYSDNVEAVTSGLLAQVTTNTQNIAINSGRIDTFTQLPSGSTSGDAELQDIRVGANGVAYATAGDAVRKQIQNIEDSYVQRDGTAQVKIKNIAGMIQTSQIMSSPNIFSSAILVAEGKYVAAIDPQGKVALFDNAAYNTYIIAVNGEDTYTFTNCRFACLVLDLEYTAVGSILSNVTNINSTGGNYILFSFVPSSFPIETYSITYGSNVYRVPDYIISSNYRPITKSVRKALNNGETIEINDCRNALKSGYTIIFKGIISSFNAIVLNFMAGSTVTNLISVDNDNITIKNSYFPVTENHGLTIANDFALIVNINDGNAEIELVSNGEIYKKTIIWHQISGTVSYPAVVSNNSVFSDAKLDVIFTAAKNKLWYFGDSYISMGDPARWPYYLTENGFGKKTTFSGSSGCGSNSSVLAFQTLLQYGMPEYAVFATGMNDGSDTTTMPALFTNTRDMFINLCTQNGIEPIFATIPTVPTVNNELKNAWIRSSGYRYIDYAKAVGANASGQWYAGMISGDNVHPSIKGAKALYTQALIDLPELCE